MYPEYRTSDLYFAAYLRTAGVSLTRTDKEGRRVFFVFCDQGEIDDLKKQYFNRTAQVVALNYADEVRSLKSMLFL